MLRDAHHSLQTEHSALVQDVADGKRFFWLGSGISREQVPDVVEILQKVLIYLRDRAAEEGPDSPHRIALVEILEDHLAEELSRYHQHGSTWVPQSCEPLRTKYAEVLEARVEGKPTDYLMLTAADIPNTYGRTDISPGICHKFLAILIAEGVLTEIASGNWDGLVETALSELTGHPQALGVYVTNEDLRASNARAHIAKFHGCAVLAREKPDPYASLLIATRAQISRFESHQSFQHMRNSIRVHTTTYRYLVLGLSIQDNDLLNLFTKSAESQPWSWDKEHPAYLFAQPKIKPPQRAMLENSYSKAYALNSREIETRSAIGNYAAPVLAALTIEVLTHKMIALLERGHNLHPQLVPDLSRGIQKLTKIVSASAGNDEAALHKFITGPYSHFVKTHLGLSCENSYVPLVRGPRSRIISEPELTAMGTDQFAAVIGLFGWGEIKQQWKVRHNSTDGLATLEMIASSNTKPTRIAIVRGSIEANAILETESWATSPDRFAIIYTTEKPKTSRRTSASTLGRGRRKTNRPELHWSSMTAGSACTDEITQRLNAELQS